MMFVDCTQTDLNEPISQSFFHDPSKGGGVRSPVTLIGVVDIGVRIDMKDGQLGAAAAPRAHDRMRDGMIAAKTNQSIARLECADDPLIDDIPRISGTVELNIAV